MKCDAQSLLSASACYRCIPKSFRPGVQIYLWCKIAGSGLYYCSPNLGQTWIDQPLANPLLFNGGTCIAFGKGVFCVSGFGPSFSSISPDALNWTPGPSTMTNSHWSSMTFGNGLFVVSGNTPGGMEYSSDGLNWNPIPVANLPWNATTFANGMFVSVTSASAIYSFDGINWFNGVGQFGATWKPPAFGAGCFVSVNNSGGVMRSTDGINWGFVAAPLQNWGAITYGNGRFVVAAGDNSGFFMWSTDGINWNLIAGGPVGYANSAAYGCGVYVAVGGLAGHEYINTSTDGINWISRVDAPTSDADYLFAVAFAKGIFVALRNTTGYYTSGI